MIFMVQMLRQIKMYWSQGIFDWISTKLLGDDKGPLVGLSEGAIVGAFDGNVVAVVGLGEGDLLGDALGRGVGEEG